MMSQHPLDLPTLNAHARLPHHLCILADPNDEDELNALGLRIISVLNPHVGVLRLCGIEVSREF